MYHLDKNFKISHTELIEHSMQIGHLWAPYYTDDPLRHYHNVYHIQDMISTAWAMEIDLYFSTLWAILFHDAVYIPSFGDNEEASAHLSRIVLETSKLFSDVPTQEIASLVEDGIIATKTHHYAINAGDEDYDNNPATNMNYLIDLDLFVNYKNYQENIKNIEKEFSFLPREQWVNGRKEFLQKMISRDTIFITDRFVEYTDPYKQLMCEELESLGNE